MSTDDDDARGDGKPWAFYDLPESAYPITFRAIGKQTGRELWSITLPAPVVFEFPPLDLTHGEGVRIYLHTADGEVEIEEH